MAAVPYEEAIATLQTMFGGLDREIIIDVLESHMCQMEPTVDALLVLTSAQGANPKERQAGESHAPPTDSTRRTLSSNDSHRRSYSQQGGRSGGYGSSKPHPEDAYEDALVSGSLKEKMVTAPARTMSAGSAALRKITEVMADWGFASRKSSSEYSLANESEYASSSAPDDPPQASTSYAKTAGQLLDTVQTATAEGIKGVSSSFRRSSTVKHRQRASNEEDSLLRHDDEFEDGAVLSKEDTQREERQSLTSTWEQDEDDDQEFVKKEH